MNIIVTGALGFVGSNIVRRLQKMGVSVLAVDDLSFGSMKNHTNGVSYMLDDFIKLVKDEFLMKRNQILIHCATSNIIYAMDHPVETFKNNAEKTIELFRAFEGKIIYTSTSSVYGNSPIVPTPEFDEIRSSNAYDISKHIAELYLQTRGNYTTLRLSNVYGYGQLADNPYCGVIGKMIEAAQTSKSFNVYGKGISTRDYTFVDDVVEAVLAAIRCPAQNTEINIGTGVETSVNELIDIVNTNKCGCKLRVFNVPERKIDVITHRRLDVRQAEKLLDWKPQTDIETGMVKTMEWYAKLLRDIQKEVSAGAIETGNEVSEPLR
jgi:UDP-glucose 4-epimerase